MTHVSKFCANKIKFESRVVDGVEDLPMYVHAAALSCLHAQLRCSNNADSQEKVEYVAGQIR